MEHLSDLILWYLISLVASLALAPVVTWLFTGLADRGACFVRPMAALLTVWPAWYLAGIGSGVVSFGPAALWVTLALLGAGSWALGLRSGTFTRETIGHLVLAETGYLGAFVLFAWLRGYGPDLTFQEKLSDLMMLSSTMRAERMPPADGWLAGETINYYYGGYVIWGGLARMVDTTPAIAFNLALISVFAMTFTSAVGLVANTVAIWRSPRTARIVGLFGGFLVVISGTLWAAIKAITDGSTYWHQWFFTYAWGASRTVIDTPGSSGENITEFPAFSFLLGDLHPHVMALPYAITTLGIALAFTQLPRLKEGHRSATLARIGLATVPIGALYAINSWDYPTYLLVALVALAIGTSGWSTANRLMAGSVLVVGSILAWLPFYVHFETPTRDSGSAFAGLFGGLPVIGGVLASVVAAGYHTSIPEYLGLVGFPWLITIALIALVGWQRRDRTDDPAVRVAAILSSALLVLTAALLGAPVVVMAGLPILAIILLIERDRAFGIENVSLALLGIGLLLTIIPELVFLLDVFSRRMNTMFKIYYQAWLLLAVGTGLAMLCLWRAVRGSALGSALVAATIAVVLVGGSAFPVLATQQWLNWRAPEREWSGWDGLDDLDQDPAYTGDAQAYRWLLENSKADDVMLAAGGCEWSVQVSRTASATGIPTILGWAGHESQWHLGEPGFESQLIQRTEDINTLGGHLDPALVDTYGMTLIFVGVIEQEGAGTADENQPGPTCAPGPFPGARNPAWPGPGWTEVYNQDGVRIYRRDGT